VRRGVADDIHAVTPAQGVEGVLQGIEAGVGALFGKEGELAVFAGQAPAEEAHPLDPHAALAPPVKERLGGGQQSAVAAFRGGKRGPVLLADPVLVEEGQSQGAGTSFEAAQLEGAALGETADFGQEDVVVVLGAGEDRLLGNFGAALRPLHRRGVDPPGPLVEEGGEGAEGEAQLGNGEVGEVADAAQAEFLEEEGLPGRPDPRQGGDGEGGDEARLAAARVREAGCCR